MMGFFNNNDGEIKYLLDAVRNLTDRVQCLEKETRYIADQPKTIQDGSFLAWQAMQNAYQNQPHFNAVPITDVVNAIVKHLGMEIEKVSEQTINKPMEVKVVEKKPSVTIVGMEGTTGQTVWSNPCPPLTVKQKRKYTKRKTGGSKNAK